MNDALEAAIKHAATQAANASTAVEALQYTQAAVNAANALACLSNIQK